MMQRVHLDIRGRILILMSLFIGFSCSNSKRVDENSINANKKNSRVLLKTDFGDKWPFSIEKGLLVCTDNKIYITAEGKTYGINGIAKQSKIPCTFQKLKKFG
jgi:hypothetical protein